MYSLAISAVLAFFSCTLVVRPAYAQGNSTNSSSSGQPVFTFGNFTPNGFKYSTYLFYPRLDPLPQVNYNDVLVFAGWTNYTNLYIIREMMGSGYLQTASNYLATTLSPTGTLSYSFTSEPTAAGVSYPYNATFGVGNYFTGATGRSIGPGVGNVIVVVTSTSGTPVTYVNPATTTVYPSGGSSMSTSASATHTGAAMGRFGVNAAAAVVGALVPAVMVL